MSHKIIRMFTSLYKQLVQHFTIQVSNNSNGTEKYIQKLCCVKMVLFYVKHVLFYGEDDIVVVFSHTCLMLMCTA